MLLACDTETTGLDLRHGCSPFIVSICDESGKTQAWEWSVDPFTRKVDVNGIHVQEIKERLSGNEIIFHHATYDLRALANIGLHLQSQEPYWTVPPILERDHGFRVPVARIHDTLLCSHLVDSRGVIVSKGKKHYSSHALKNLALVRLGISAKDETLLRKATVHARTVHGKKLGWSLGTNLHGEATVGADYWMDKLVHPLSTLAVDYAKLDAYRTMLLFLVCREIITEDGNWPTYLEETELIPILYMLEEVGIHIQAGKLDSELANHNKSIERLNALLVRLAGNKDFNINSHPQLSELLFTRWQLESMKKTKSKKDSVDKEVITSLRDSLTATEDGKRPSKPLQFLRALIGYKDGSRPVPGLRTHQKAADYLWSYTHLLRNSRVHPSINPVLRTTRFSYTEPNGQNISKKQQVDSETGEEIVSSLRAVFGPPKGWTWFSIDYSQLELRLFAAISKDDALIKAFDDGHDFHAFVATRLFNLPPEKISAEQRTQAKNTNFAMIYGGSSWKVDATAGMKGAYERFSTQFPNARSFMDETIALCRIDNCIETADGYPLRTPPREPFKGVDYRIQGTAGRIVKLAMRWLVFGRTGHRPTGFNILPEIRQLIDWNLVKMVINVHDELVFEINTTVLSRKKTAAIVRRIATVMEEAGQSMGITTPVDIEVHPSDWSKKVTLREWEKKA